MKHRIFYLMKTVTAHQIDVEAESEDEAKSKVWGGKTNHADSRPLANPNIDTRNIFAVTAKE